MPTVEDIGKVFSICNLKEFVMNETQVLEVVDLGDAKELTQGLIEPEMGEDHPTLVYRDK